MFNFNFLFLRACVYTLGAHHVEASPEAVHVLWVAYEDENHHPLNQILH